MRCPHGSRASRTTRQGGGWLNQSNAMWLRRDGSDGAPRAITRRGPSREGAAGSELEPRVLISKRAILQRETSNNTASRARIAVCRASCAVVRGGWGAPSGRCDPPMRWNCESLVHRINISSVSGAVSTLCFASPYPTDNAKRMAGASASFRRNIHQLVIERPSRPVIVHPFVVCRSVCVRCAKHIKIPLIISGIGAVWEDGGSMRGI